MFSYLNSWIKITEAKERNRGVLKFRQKETKGGDLNPT